VTTSEPEGAFIASLNSHQPPMLKRTPSISWDDGFMAIGMSSSRFAHLFKQQAGLPFRRYMLWRTLTRVMLAIGKERTIAAGATLLLVDRTSTTFQRACHVQQHCDFEGIAGMIR
jgi:hypothetical protein